MSSGAKCLTYKGVRETLVHAISTRLAVAFAQCLHGSGQFHKLTNAPESQAYGPKVELKSRRASEPLKVDGDVLFRRPYARCDCQITVIVQIGDLAEWCAMCPVM